MLGWVVFVAVTANGSRAALGHRVCDALLERQVPGLHVVSYSEGIVCALERAARIFPQNVRRVDRLARQAVSPALGGAPHPDRPAVTSGSTVGPSGDHQLDYHLCI